MSDTNGYPTTQGPNQATSEYNAQAFIFDYLMNRRHFAEPVLVVGVDIPVELDKPGRVSVMPLVNMLDANGNAIGHGTIKNLIYFRLQGGANAVVIDPQVGDKGIAIFMDRDISAVKSTEGIANPGSARRSSWSDGWYIGGTLNGVPTQYVRLSDAGVEVVSPLTVKVVAPSVKVEAAAFVEFTTPVVTMSGNLSVATGANCTISDTSGTTFTVQNGLVLNKV